MPWGLKIVNQLIQALRNVVTLAAASIVAKRRIGFVRGIRATQQINSASQSHDLTKIVLLAFAVAPFNNKSGQCGNQLWRRTDLNAVFNTKANHCRSVYDINKRAFPLPRHTSQGVIKRSRAIHAERAMR